MGWELIFIAVALFYAIKTAAANATDSWKKRRAQKKDHRARKSQLVTQAIAEGQAPRGAKKAAEIGANAAVTVTSWGAMWIAFKDGWRDGWEQGREKGTEMKDGVEPHSGTRNSATSEPPTAESIRADHEKNRECTAVVGDFVDDNYQRLPRFCGAAVKEGYRLCPRHCAESDRDSPPSEDKQDKPPSGCAHPEVGALLRSYTDQNLCVFSVRIDTLSCGHGVPILCGNPEGKLEKNRCSTHQTAQEEKGQGMAIETGNVGGEILTKDQFEQAMQAIVAEETAEIEDANGDLKRAEEHIKQVEVMAASLSSAEIDQATVVAVRAFIDGSSTRMQDAKQRVANAEVRKAGAEKALSTLKASRQNQFYSA